MRMTYLITVVGREGRRAIEVVGVSALFYARTLKTLNRKFGNTLLVAHLRFKSRLNKPQIKPNDRAPLREICQQIKLHITWHHVFSTLSSICFKKKILQIHKGFKLS